MALDALFIGAHPDDVELTSGGLAALLASHGHAVGIADLTRGEMASRGTVDERLLESEAAARQLGVAKRVNLGLPDCGVDRSNREHIGAVVTLLRAERPRLVVAPDRDDAHPDHVEGSHLVTRACYLAGLARFHAAGERHRPERLLYALYRGASRAHLVVDVSAAWEKRMAALSEHRSQLDPAGGPATYLTHPEFLSEVEARGRTLGSMIGARYGEGYRTRGPVAFADARGLLGPGAGSIGR